MLDTVIMVNNSTVETQNVFTGIIHTANGSERCKYSSSCIMPAADMTA